MTLRSAFTALAHRCSLPILPHIPTPPSLCAICRGWGRQRICAACLGRFAAPRPRCTRCALTVPAGVVLCGACVSDPPPYVQAIAAVDYGHPWDALITHFKFHAALDLAPALARLLRDAVARAASPTGEPPGAPPMLVLPVPLSAERMRERGYNQAWELARRIARGRRDCQLDARLLLRIKDTAHQLALPLEERSGNVCGAFAVEPRRLVDVRDRRIAIVDDVMTTGATVAEITHALLQAGARDVAVWALARTPRPDDA